MPVDWDDIWLLKKQINKLKKRMTNIEEIIEEEKKKKHNEFDGERGADGNGIN